MEEIRWGIIGCGDVTEVKSGPAFNQVPGSKLVAVMRRDGAKAADYAKRHKVPKWYDKATDLINDPEVNAVYVATPPLQHEEYTLEALAAGKPVYVEKPMALNAAAARRMIKAATENNTRLSIAHYRRAQPMFLKIKELLAEKIIGELRLVDLKMFQAPKPDVNGTNWRTDPAVSGGGLFHDLAPHQLDLMLYFFGPIKKSMGMATRQQENTQADDLVVGQVLFENGLIFNGRWCFSVSPQEQADSFEIYGSKGKITFSMFGYTLYVAVDGVEKVYNFEPLAHVQQPMIARVVDYFSGKGENPCDGPEALIIMELLDEFTRQR